MTSLDTLNSFHCIDLTVALQRSTLEIEAAAAAPASCNRIFRRQKIMQYYGSALIHTHNVGSTT